MIKGNTLCPCCKKQGTLRNMPNHETLYTCDNMKCRVVEYWTKQEASKIIEGLNKGRVYK